jgi:prepilin-type N-terminal cleavage/methylation domain-containing protein
VPRRNAYTLLELILVIAIIVLFAGVSIPTINGMYSHYRLLASSDAVRAGWVRARSHAVDEGQRYRFAVVPGKGNFRIAPDSAEYWGGGTLPTPDPDNPPLVLEDILPTPVTFAIEGSGGGSRDDSDSLSSTSIPVGQVNAGDWVPRAYFEVDGSAAEDVTITFESRGAGRVILSLRALTGISSVKNAAEGRD